MKDIISWLNTEDCSDYKEKAFKVIQEIVEEHKVEDKFDQYILGKFFEQLASHLKDGSKQEIYDSIEGDTNVYKELIFSKRAKADKYIHTDYLLSKQRRYVTEIKELKSAEIESGDAEFEDGGTQFILMGIFKG